MAAVHKVMDAADGPSSATSEAPVQPVSRRMDKWVHRLQERRSRNELTPPEPPGREKVAEALPVVAEINGEQDRAGQGGETARWLARGRAQSAMSGSRGGADAGCSGSQTGAEDKTTAGSKAARWAARAQQQSAAAAGMSASEQSRLADQVADQQRAAALGDPHNHPYQNGKWAIHPVANSAMEAWMARAAAKDLHLPWAEKRHDADEITLQRQGLSIQEIHARRYHLNSPEVDRTYSSVFDSQSMIPGLQWAQSCLEAPGCWRPAEDEERAGARPWMEIDLQCNTSIVGVVTQGLPQLDARSQNLYLKADWSKLDSSQMHVTQFQVWCRPDGCHTLGAAPEWETFEHRLFSREGGGSDRHETAFPHAVVARHVRIVVVNWKGHVMMRAGVMVPKPLDAAAVGSPFSVAVSADVPVGVSADVPGEQRRCASKASRWAARATGDVPGRGGGEGTVGGRAAAADLAKIAEAAGLPALLAPPPDKSAADIPMVGPANKVTGGSKAARWAARAAGKVGAGCAAATMPKAADWTPGSAVITDVAVHGGGGKAMRWAARAAHRVPVGRADAALEPAAQSLGLLNTTSGSDSAGGQGQARDGFTPDGTDEILYGQVRNQEVHYSGFLKYGLPETQGEILWPSGHGYSGGFRNGKAHGKGTHYFPDGKTSLTCSFANGCPEGTGLLFEAPSDEHPAGRHWDVTYAEGAGLAIQDGAMPESKEEAACESRSVQRMPFIGITVGAPSPVRGLYDGTGKERDVVSGHYPNVPAACPKDGSRKVMAPVVWARPKHGDQPLWNAAEVRGKIVIMLRGPAKPATTASYGLKLFYAQQAGAVALVIINHDKSESLYAFIPQIVEGPVTSGVPPIPAEAIVKARIPTVFMHNVCLAGIREHDQAALVFEPQKKPCADGHDDKADWEGFGWQLGIMFWKDYEGSGGLSKSKANDLMAQFLEDRRKDLEQETQLSAKHRGLDKAEESLRGREFYGGNFLQSMNPFKQVAATDGLDEKIAGRVVNSLVNTSGFDRWTVQMRRLQRGLGQAIPLQVAWDDGIPSLKTREVLPCVRVFSCTGRPDCAVHARDNIMKMNAKVEGKYGVQEMCIYPTSKNGTNFTWLLTIDDAGVHVSWDGTWRYCFKHRSQWNPGISDDIVLVQNPGRNPVQIKELGQSEGICNPKMQQAEDTPAPPALDINLEDWTLVFRQTAPFQFSADDDFAQARLLNPKSPLADNFSILGQLDQYRCSDGYFTFLLRYPEESSRVNIWRQTSNPVEMQEEGVDGFEAVQTHWGGVKWQGLQRTDRRRHRRDSFLDGCVCDSQHWAYAIGVAPLPTGQYNSNGDDFCIPGPLSGDECVSMTQVELYVSTKWAVPCPTEKKNQDPHDTEWHQGTAKDNPLCEHGQKKSECQMCKDSLAGRFILEHTPHLPCLPGHGRRWLWDQGKHCAGNAQLWCRPQRLTFDSGLFFADMVNAPARSCKRDHWPLPYSPAFGQDLCNGFFSFVYKDELHYSGMLRRGLPDDYGCLKWADGSEYHGEFDDGEMTGYGRYLFPDGGEFRGIFARGMPQQGFYLPPNNDHRRITDYVDRMPNTPLWDMDNGALLHASMQDLPLPQYAWTKADGMAITACRSNFQTGEIQKDFSHMKNVSARLVWARPIYADQPLWNADECRGKIVAIMRGPRPPARPCSYNIKMFHAQNAGAVGVVVVDYDPDGRFSVVPRAELGPLYPNGPDLRKLSIPGFLTLYSMAGALQDGAVTTMMMAPPTPKGLEQGWRLGVIYCRKQENQRSGLSRAKADLLMSEFFEQRRHERAEEQELMQDKLHDLKCGIDPHLSSKEWVGGNVFDSLNVLKQDRNAPPPKTRSGSITQAMLAKVTTQSKARELAEQVESAGALIGSVFHGAVATMTAEAASETVVALNPLSSQPVSSSRTGGQGSALEHKLAQEQGVEGQPSGQPRSATHTPRRGLRVEHKPSGNQSSPADASPMPQVPNASPTSPPLAKPSPAAASAAPTTPRTPAEALTGSTPSSAASPAASLSESELRSRIQSLEEENRRLVLERDREREMTKNLLLQSPHSAAADSPVATAAAATASSPVSASASGNAGPEIRRGGGSKQKQEPKEAAWGQLEEYLQQSSDRIGAQMVSLLGVTPPRSSSSRPASRPSWMKG